MIYLHPASPLQVSVTFWHDTFGILNSPHQAIRRENIIGKWAMDNDAFANWDAMRFMKALGKYTGLPECLFVVCPDVVGNHERTLHRFWIWHTVIREYGYPVAFVAQDGLTSFDPVPFDEIDALFIGGSNAFKLGTFVASLVKEAKERGKWVHMGRVNSFRRLRYAYAIGCDSADGTVRAFDQEIVTRFPAYLLNKQELLWS